MEITDEMVDRAIDLIEDGVEYNQVIDEIQTMWTLNENEANIVCEMATDAISEG